MAANGLTAFGYDVLDGINAAEPGAVPGLTGFTAGEALTTVTPAQAAQVQAALKGKPLTLAPGAAEAAAEHALLLLPRLRLLDRQRADLARRIDAILKELASAPEGRTEHRDAAILLSLPGLGRKVAATMLSEASQAIAERDYHALRCYGGAAPITRQSGKKKSVSMRQGCNERLRNALYHWSRTSVVWEWRPRWARRAATSG